nr:hypothetical protein [Burkholderia ambifaria]
MSNEQAVYQRIGEFTVSFQWIENKLREIGWFILDPERTPLDALLSARMAFNSFQFDALDLLKAVVEKSDEENEHLLHYVMPGQSPSEASRLLVSQ